MCALFRLWGLSVLLCALAVLLSAATLEQMSLDDLVQKSTSIVQGRAGSSRSIREGALFYTLHKFAVLNRWKGEPAPEVEIALPGGSIGGLQQDFGGVPQLEPGREYVVFLWKGPSGRTQITGFSQGVFEVVRGSGGSVIVRRKPNADLTLSPGTGKAVETSAIEMPLADLAARIRQMLGSGRTPTP
jgi:hypothetical protein